MNKEERIDLWVEFYFYFYFYSFGIPNPQAMAPLKLKMQNTKILSKQFMGWVDGGGGGCSHEVLKNLALALSGVLGTDGW